MGFAWQLFSPVYFLMRSSMHRNHQTKRKHDAMKSGNVLQKLSSICISSLLRDPTAPLPSHRSGVTAFMSFVLHFFKLSAGPWFSQPIAFRPQPLPPRKTCLTEILIEIVRREKYNSPTFDIKVTIKDNDVRQLMETAETNDACSAPIIN